MANLTRVSVLRSHPDERLHGYVGEVVETVGRSFRVRFLIKIRNEFWEALVPWVDCRPL